ncbi:hypothetical protein A0256_07035 [Mucilaginibacter sp. PAMC 26640]|nr:hypothetical protein A0256_07035 [Mucilaginibacter sp. PAMC 26640]
MKINEFVFDTNALISALLIPTSVSRQALRRADDIGKLAFSTETLDELKLVIVRTKFDKYLPVSERLEFVQRWELRGSKYKIISQFTDCRDEKDNKFLNLAFDSGCSTLVSGDKDLLRLHPFHGIDIITANCFLNQFS